MLIKKTSVTNPRSLGIEVEDKPVKRTGSQGFVPLAPLAKFEVTTRHEGGETEKLVRSLLRCKGFRCADAELRKALLAAVPVGGKLAVELMRLLADPALAAKGQVEQRAALKALLIGAKARSKPGTAGPGELDLPPLAEVPPLPTAGDALPDAEAIAAFTEDADRAMQALVARREAIAGDLDAAILAAYATTAPAGAMDPVNDLTAELGATAEAIETLNERVGIAASMQASLSLADVDAALAEIRALQAGLADGGLPEAELEAIAAELQTQTTNLAEQLRNMDGRAAELTAHLAANPHDVAARLELSAIGVLSMPVAEGDAAITERALQVSLAHQIPVQLATGAPVPASGAAMARLIELDAARSTIAAAQEDSAERRAELTPQLEQLAAAAGVKIGEPPLSAQVERVADALYLARPGSWQDLNAGQRAHLLIGAMQMQAQRVELTGYMAQAGLTPSQGPRAFEVGVRALAAKLDEKASNPPVSGAFRHATSLDELLATDAEITWPLETEWSRLQSVDGVPTQVTETISLTCRQDAEALKARIGCHRSPNAPVPLDRVYLDALQQHARQVELQGYQKIWGSTDIDALAKGHGLAASALEGLDEAAKTETVRKHIVEVYQRSASTLIATMKTNYGIDLGRLDGSPERAAEIISKARSPFAELDIVPDCGGRMTTWEMEALWGFGRQEAKLSHRALSRWEVDESDPSRPSGTDLGTVTNYVTEQRQILTERELESLGELVDEAGGSLTWQGVLDRIDADAGVVKRQLLMHLVDVDSQGELHPSQLFMGITGDSAFDAYGHLRAPAHFTAEDVSIDPGELDDLKEWIGRKQNDQIAVAGFRGSMLEDVRRAYAAVGQMRGEGGKSYKRQFGEAISEFGGWAFGHTLGSSAGVRPLAKILDRYCTQERRLFDTLFEASHEGCEERPTCTLTEALRSAESDLEPAERTALIHILHRGDAADQVDAGLVYKGEDGYGSVLDGSPEARAKVDALTAAYGVARGGAVDESLAGGRLAAQQVHTYHLRMGFFASVVTGDGGESLISEAIKAYNAEHTTKMSVETLSFDDLDTLLDNGLIEFSKDQRGYIRDGKKLYDAAQAEATTYQALLDLDATALLKDGPIDATTLKRSLRRTVGRDEASAIVEALGGEPFGPEHAGSLARVLMLRQYEAAQRFGLADGEFRQRAALHDAVGKTTLSSYTQSLDAYEDQVIAGGVVAVATVATLGFAAPAAASGFGTWTAAGLGAGKAALGGFAVASAASLAWRGHLELAGRIRSNEGDSFGSLVAGDMWMAGTTALSTAIPYMGMSHAKKAYGLSKWYQAMAAHAVQNAGMDGLSYGMQYAQAVATGTTGELPGYDWRRPLIFAGTGALSGSLSHHAEKLQSQGNALAYLNQGSGKATFGKVLDLTGDVLFAGADQVIGNKLEGRGAFDGIHMSAVGMLAARLGFSDGGPSLESSKLGEALAGHEVQVSVDGPKTKTVEASFVRMTKSGQHAQVRYTGADGYTGTRLVPAAELVRINAEHPAVQGVADAFSAHYEKAAGLTAPPVASGAGGGTFQLFAKPKVDVDALTTKLEQCHDGVRQQSTALIDAAGGLLRGTDEGTPLSVRRDVALRALRKLQIDGRSLRTQAATLTDELTRRAALPTSHADHVDAAQLKAVADASSSAPTLELIDALYSKMGVGPGEAGIVGSLAKTPIDGSGVFADGVSGVSPETMLAVLSSLDAGKTPLSAGQVADLTTRIEVDLKQAAKTEALSQADVDRIALDTTLDFAMTKLVGGDGEAPGKPEGLPAFEVVRDVVQMTGRSETDAVATYEALVAANAMDAAVRGEPVDFDALVESGALVPDHAAKLETLYEEYAAWRAAPTDEAQKHLADTVAALPDHMRSALLERATEGFTQSRLQSTVAAGEPGDLAQAVRTPLQLGYEQAAALGLGAEFKAAAADTAARLGLVFEDGGLGYRFTKPGEQQHADLAWRLAGDPALSAAFRLETGVRAASRDGLALRVAADPQLQKRLVEWFQTRTVDPATVDRLAKGTDASSPLIDGLRQAAPRRREAAEALKALSAMSDVDRARLLDHLSPQLDASGGPAALQDAADRARRLGSRDARRLLTLALANRSKALTGGGPQHRRATAELEFLVKGLESGALDATLVIDPTTGRPDPKHGRLRSIELLRQYSRSGVTGRRTLDAMISRPEVLRGSYAEALKLAQQRIADTRGLPQSDPKRQAALDGIRLIDAAMSAPQPDRAIHAAKAVLAAGVDLSAVPSHIAQAVLQEAGTSALGDASPHRGLIAPYQVAGGLDVLTKSPKRNELLALLQSAPSAAHQAVLTKAMAAHGAGLLGADPAAALAQITAFADKISTFDRQALAAKTSMDAFAPTADAHRLTDGAQQVFGTSCAPSSVLCKLAHADPILALRFNEEPAYFRQMQESIMVSQDAGSFARPGSGGSEAPTHGILGVHLEQVLANGTAIGGAISEAEISALDRTREARVGPDSGSADEVLLHALYVKLDPDALLGIGVRSFEGFLEASFEVRGTFMDRFLNPTMAPALPGTQHRRVPLLTPAAANPLTVGARVAEHGPALIEALRTGHDVAFAVDWAHDPTMGHAMVLCDYAPAAELGDMQVKLHDPWTGEACWLSLTDLFGPEPCVSLLPTGTSPDHSRGWVSALHLPVN